MEIIDWLQGAGGNGGGSCITGVSHPPPHPPRTLAKRINRCSTEFRNQFIFLKCFRSKVACFYLHSACDKYFVLEPESFTLTREIRGCALGFTCWISYFCNPLWLNFPLRNDMKVEEVRLIRMLITFQNRPVLSGRSHLSR